MFRNRLIYIVIGLAIAPFDSSVWGGQLAPYGEEEIQLQVVEARFAGGKVVARCGSNGDLVELLLEWAGKAVAIPKSEISDISLADLQSLRITVPMPGPPVSKPSDGHESHELFVTMAYGPQIVRDSLLGARCHVRFEFSDASYNWRFKAVPEKLGLTWTIYFKAVGKREKEFAHHEGRLQPWSLVRDYDSEMNDTSDKRMTIPGPRQVEQPGSAQPATQPADKSPVKDQPSIPTSKDAPR